MKTILTFSTLLFAFGPFDKGNTKAEHYQTNDFDCAIFPSKYKPADLQSVSLKKRFKPTHEEIDEAEAALNTQLAALNAKQAGQLNGSEPGLNQLSQTAMQNTKGYQRQYFGCINEAGDKILYINCFSSKDDYAKRTWLNGELVVMGGGSSFWKVKFNLKSQRWFDLKVNGPK
jgi:hypothetical protein